MEKNPIRGEFFHLEKRGEDQLGRSFSLSDKDPTHLFALSPCDWGVCRNGGRRGASLAPKAILGILKKMALPEEVSPIFKAISTIRESKGQSFEQYQNDQADSIKELLNESIPLIHLGGGHDHIYPLLMAVKALNKKMTVVNIDAHLDTRPDHIHHSGTPFRQFFQEEDFTLIQLGIQRFSNPKENYEKLSLRKMKVIPCDSLSDLRGNLLQDFLKKEIPLEKNSITILSLDCDGMTASQMEAVSAVNPYGLDVQTIQGIFSFYKNQIHHPPLAGIYEYNPLYDNLSQKGARILAALIYNLLF